MKRKLLLIPMFFVGSLFVSCSSDETEKKPEPPVVVAPLPISITATTPEFITAGENLEIAGTNFTNKNYPTKVFVNEIEVTPKEITDTKVILSSPNIKSGENTVRVQIQGVNSTLFGFYAMAKGWNKLTTLGNLDIQSSTVFDNSKTIFSFADNDASDNGFWGAPKKLEGKSTGYASAYIPQSGSYGDFKMIDEKTGVLTNTIAGFFTDSGFETKKTITVTNAFSPAINGLKVGYLDDNICILTTLLSGQIYTKDKGATIVKNDPPAWAAKITAGGGVSSRLGASAYGKSVSDNKFYQLGMLYDLKKYGSNNYKNVVLQSETGYDNWIVKDTISKFDLKYSSSYKFVNINKIFTMNKTDKTLVVSTDMLQTWNVIKTDVTAFFLRSETQWYIQSGDKLYVTKNSGTSWELELELPAGSVVNDISFSKSKIIVSGNKGLHYLKLE